MVLIRRFLVVGVFLIMMSVGMADQRSSFFTSSGSVKIEPSKEVFEVGEPLDGKIKIENVYANGIPVVFIIKLFHEDKQVNVLTTSIPHVPFGEMTTTFKSFGIPTFNSDPSSVGKWKIVIFLQDDDENKAQSTNIEIIPNSKGRF